jgi:hypothetical protein
MRVRLGLAAFVSTLALLLTSGAISASSITTPNVVTLLNSNGTLDVRVRINCSPPQPMSPAHRPRLVIRL